MKTNKRCAWYNYLILCKGFQVYYNYRVKIYIQIRQKMTTNKGTDNKGMHIYIQVHILQSYKSSRAPVFVVANVRRVRRERERESL